ncbi:MAG: hypothetical protein A2V21_313215 [Deltaproteobacteria bacterium GWC2_55_46]|nr:MAG: hypothetical protein A2Z79_07400 [Deltaproteobacteria bacterium GWA2_55_82]OIJ72589.1 MAG: hypothetical protein A2V21_313215 [Deltaproteobacteria bacterium GWC2_55_46]
MAEEKTPRLRTVFKVPPPFPLNKFPTDFPYKLAKELVYLLATKGKPVLEGAEWEEIFATCIGAIWKPSNVGLDDVVLDACAWGAKTVKAAKPAKQKRIRLISGRNSPAFSFGVRNFDKINENDLGKQILSIWNERVSGIRKTHKHLRTVVLIKSNFLDELAIFEFETIRYDPELYFWKRNKRNNLEGYEKASKKHIFTWQPHGSQFTIIEDVPDDCTIIKIKTPQKTNKEAFLKNIGFDKTWFTVYKKNARENLET